MSVSAPGDIQGAQGGFGEPASSPMPAEQFPGLPTDGTAPPMTDPQITSEQASEGGDAWELTEDDVSFLQTEQVRNWFAQNLPDGYVPKDQLERDINNLRSVKDREVEEARRQAEGQLAEIETQRNAIVGALEQAWQELGLQPNSEEWNQRVAQLRNALGSQINAQKVQRYESENQSRQQLAQTAAMVGQRFAAAGLPLAQYPQLQAQTRDFLSRYQRGEFQSQFAFDQALNMIVAQARQTAAPPQVQQPPAQQQAAQPSTPPQQPARPQWGPTRTVRGGGGGTPRSHEQVYAEGIKQLAQQYGGELNIPQQERDRLDIEAMMAAAGA